MVNVFGKSLKVNNAYNFITDYNAAKKWLKKSISLSYIKTQIRQTH